MPSRRHQLPKPRAALVVAAIIALLLIGPGTYSPAGAALLAAQTLSISPSAGPAGSTVMLTGSGYTPSGYAGTIQWDGVDQSTFTIPNGGSFSVNFTIPAKAAPGKHTITVCASCGSGEFAQTADAFFDLQSPATDTPVPPTDTPAPTDTPEPTPTDTPVPTPTEFAGGGFIVFTSNRAEDGTFNLWRMDTDGSNLAQITTDFGEAVFADISPDGSRIAFSSMDTDTWLIYLTDADGSNLEQFTDFSSAVSDWSPDGNGLIFNSDHDDEPVDTPDIWAMNLDGTGLVELLDEPPTADFNPQWSPDGSQVLFVSDRTGNFDLFVMDADGSNIVQLTDDPGRDFEARWSPDGGRIAFASDRAGTQDIWLMEADGGNLVQLTDFAGIQDDPAWSPDGQYIVFGSDHGGQWDLWRISVDGADLVQITDDEFLDFFPDW